MNLRTSLYGGLLAGGLLFAGTSLAQDTPAPAASASATAADTATFNTPQGQVVVNSAPAPAPTIGPAPSFQQLAAGGKSITEEQASAYPPLANDFLNADSNKNGKISETEYARWVKQLR
ncbi:MAG: hypothetical protein ACTHJO_04265 [Rhodanobacter sp.]